MKSLWKISPILLIGAVAAFAAACGGEEKVVTEIQTVIVEKPVTQIEKVVETVVVERVVEGKTVTEVQTVVVEKAVVAQPTPAPAGAVPPGLRRGGHLVRGLTRMPTQWDMRQEAVWWGPQSLTRHYDGLLQFSTEDGVTIQPDLARAWQFSSDFSDLTLTLFDGIQFHDGAPLEMDDVLFAFEQLQVPPEGIVFPRLAAFRGIESVEGIDDLTVRFNLASPNVDFLQELGSTWAMVAPKSIAGGEGGINSADEIIGTGPFVLADSEEDSFIRSDANPNYHLIAPDGSPFPYLDQVTTVVIPNEDALGSAFRTGRIDLMQIGLQKAVAIEEEFGDRVVHKQSPLPGVFYLTPNADNPPFDDIRARRALYLAIDRMAIIEFLRLPSGQLPYNPVSFLGNTYPFVNEVLSYPEVNPDTRAEAAAEAKRLFEELGITEIDMLVIAIPWFEQWAQLLTQQLEDVGVTLNLSTKDAPSSLASASQGDFETYGHGGNIVVWNAMDIVQLFYLPEGGWFHHKAEPSQEFKDLFTRARATLPGPERNEMFREMEKYLREELIPAVPVMAHGGISIVGYDYVRDYRPVPVVHFQMHKFFDVWLDAGSPAR
jgi:peptide/nickel transport system substrate-binding protein